MSNNIRNKIKNLMRQSLSDQENKSNSPKNNINLNSPVKSYSLKSITEINDNNKDKEKFNMLMNLYHAGNSTLVDLYCTALSLFPKTRYKEVIKIIKNYFISLPGIMDIISKEINNEKSEKILTQILSSIQLEKFEKNNIIYKYGDYGEKFYIILRGKVGFLIPKLYKCNLNEEEYIEYLLKLKNNKEDELAKRLVSLNQQYYDLGNDFEYFIKERLYNLENKKGDLHHYSESIYEKFKELIKNIEQNKSSKQKENQKDKNIEKKIYDEIYDNELTIENYINYNKVENADLLSKDRKKVNIFLYTLINVFEDGQTFGYAALENKNNKRISTVISIKNSEFAVLSKEDYINLLQPLNTKYREMLYNLVNSNNLLGYAPKKAFDTRICHMFKYVKYTLNTVIFSEKNKINSVKIFNNGQFIFTVSKNIIDLNLLIIKLKKIRGKILGKSEEKIEKEIEKNIFNIESFKNQKYITPEILKIYNKTYDLTVSFINDKLIVGLYDTVDPETHMPLFDCKCVSHFCDGYEISIENLENIHKEYFYDISDNQLSLMRIEYYLKRLQKHKIDIENKIEIDKKDVKMDIIKKNILKENKNLNPNECESIINIYDYADVSRNTLTKDKNHQKSIVKLENKSSAIDGNLKRFNSLDKIKNQSSKLISFSINDECYNNQNNLNIINDDTNSKNNLIDTKDEETKSSKKNLFFGKLRKNIKDKEKLLLLIKQKSNKYLRDQKLIMRQLYRSEKRKDKINYDISDIFNIHSKNDKSKKLKKKDLILDNMLSNINENGRYDRILSSYMTSNKEKNKKNLKKFNESSVDRQFINVLTEINNDSERKYEISNNFSEVFPKLNNLSNKKIINESINCNTIDLEIPYSLPGIESYENKINYRDLITLKMNRNNRFRKFNNFEKKLNENKTTLKEKLLLISSRDNNDNKMVSVVDPLIMNKFNDCYRNNKLKKTEGSF